MNIKLSPVLYILVILLSIAILIGFSSCNSSNSPQDSEKKEDVQTDCLPVDIVKVKQQDMKQTILGIGTLESTQSVMIQNEVNGILKSVHFQEGQKVNRGDLLFSIEDKKITQRLKAKKAALQETKAELENTRISFRRHKRLFKQGLGSEEAKDDSRASYKVALAKIERLKAEIGEIREILHDTTINAPFTGITTEHLVDPGEWLDIGDILTSLVKTQKLKIAFTVPERYQGKVKVGQSANILVQAFPNQKIEGKVYFVSPKIEPQTRSLLVKAYIDNSDNSLLPGGFASVELTVDIRKNTLVIPEEALIPTRTGYMVFEVDEGRLHSRKVSIGLRKPGLVEIKKGLQAGVNIVSSGHISAYEGAKICPSQNQ